MTMSANKADRQFIEVLKSGLNREIEDFYSMDSNDAIAKARNDAYEDIVASIDEYLVATKQPVAETC